MWVSPAEIEARWSSIPPCSRPAWSARRTRDGLTRRTPSCVLKAGARGLAGAGRRAHASIVRAPRGRLQGRRAASTSSPTCRRRPPARSSASASRGGAVRRARRRRAVSQDAIATARGQRREALDGRRPHRRVRGVRGRARAVGLRQVHAAQHASPACCTPSAGAICFEGERARGPAADGDGVPGVRALPLAHGAGQRRVRPRGAGRARGGAARERRARFIELTGLARLRGQVPAPALGRHAPARRHRARARGRAGGAADGRAVLGARRADAPAHAGGAARASGSGRARPSSTSRTTSRRRCSWPTGSSCSRGGPARVLRDRDDRAAAPARRAPCWAIPPSCRPSSASGR